MKETPILFTPENVRKILAGTKTQTRRIIKPQPIEISWFEHQQGWCARVREDMGTLKEPAYVMVKRPFGTVGDRLWVRHTVWKRKDAEDWQPHIWNPFTRTVVWNMDGAATEGPVEEIQEKEWRKVPAIHMPKWACRLWLEITEIRVERLQDISKEDVIAEGLRAELDGGKLPDTVAARSWWIGRWESINGPGSWNQNPWVWAITFRQTREELK